MDSDPKAVLEERAREQLREVAAELEAIRFRLLGVYAALPVSPGERDPLREDDDAMDATTRIRAAIGCILEDRIAPAFRELQEAAAEPVGDS
jgi:hypothetical protein